LSVPYALYSQTAGNVQTYTAGNGINITGNVIENTAPDQTVNLTGTGATTVTGNYPNFTINSTDSNTTYSAGTGLTLTGTTFSHNAHSGDVSGITALTVTGIQNKPVSSTAPTTNQVLQYDGSSWAPTQPSNLINAGNGLTYTGNTLNSAWTQTGNNIYNNNSGRVGIGLNAPTGKLSVQGDTSNVLFEVKDKNGYSVFVVYQDSVQVFVDASGSKTNKGAFAVNPKAQSKSGSTHYLRVTPDSSRIYTEDPAGGFGVRDIGSGSSSSYMSLTPNNYFIGHNAGDNVSSSSMYNLFLGYQAGKRLYSGNSNICIGYQSGFNGYDNMSDNILFGNYAGYKTNSSSNIFIGEEAGYNNIKGYQNIYIGNNAGYTSFGYDSVPSLVYHSNNVIIGSNAGKSLSTLQGNTIIGSGACENSTNSTSSTIIGLNACQNGNLRMSTVLGVYAGASALGDDNIYIGASCGRQNVGSSNVYIGNSLLTYASDHLNNKFIVKNGYSNSHPLLFGDFDYGRLVINGDSSNNVSSLNFFVNGTAGGNFAWVNISDRKFKTNIQPISNPLEKIMQLNGVNFNWINKSWGEKTQLGFIAQDVEKVLPEVVVKNGDNYGMQYAPITALLVEGMKAQQKKIDQLEKEINELKEMLKK
jgi:hypothetical protein